METKLFKEVVALYAGPNNPAWIKLAPRSKQIYLNGIKYLRYLDDVPVNKITRPMVIQHRDSMYNKRGMCRISLTCLSNILSYAHDRGWVEYNQALNMKGLPDTQDIERWSPDEIENFIDTAPIPLRQAVILALYTGQRRSDLVRMRWDDYDGDFIKVRQQKTGKYLEIPVHNRLKEMLDAMPRVKNRGGYILLNSQNQPWQSDWLTARVAKHMRKLGYKNRSLHGLRKSAAATLAESGCTTHQIQSITGHSIEELSHYTKQANQKILAKQAISKWQTDRGNVPGV